MSWLKMTGWVETVDNEANAQMHERRAPVRLRDSVRSLLPSREAAGRADLLFFASKNACRSKFKQLWKHVRDLRSVGKHSTWWLWIYVTGKRTFKPNFIRQRVCSLQLLDGSPRALIVRLVVRTGISAHSCGTEGFKMTVLVLFN